MGSFCVFKEVEKVAIVVVDSKAEIINRIYLCIDVTNLLLLSEQQLRAKVKVAKKALTSSSKYKYVNKPPFVNRIS